MRGSRDPGESRGGDQPLDRPDYGRDGRRLATSRCRGRFQYGLLHLGFGHTFGSIAWSRGIHWWPQRSHFQAQVTTFTFAMPALCTQKGCMSTHPWKGIDMTMGKRYIPRQYSDGNGDLRNEPYPGRQSRAGPHPHAT